VVEHVVAGDATSRACAVDLVGVERVLVDETANDG
jgi:hypothetical protein